MSLTPEKLKGKIPDSVYNSLVDSVIPGFKLSTNLQLAHFISQCHYESGGFTATSENLNYLVQGLLATFPKYFDANTANQYAHKPENIANKIYANRYGNGTEASGDGWKYRGRGYIQLTFKDNYSAFAQFKGVDVVASPDSVATEYALDSAAFYFQKNGLFEKANEGSTYAISELLTKRVSGQTKTAQKRYELFVKYWGDLNM